MKVAVVICLVLLILSLSRTSAIQEADELTKKQAGANDDLVHFSKRISSGGGRGFSGGGGRGFSGGGFRGGGSSGSRGSGAGGKGSSRGTGSRGSGASTLPIIWASSHGGNHNKGHHHSGSCSLKAPASLLLSLLPVALALYHFRL